VTDYYAILGVSEQSTSDEIRSAFRRLAKAYHPDRNPEGKEQFELVVKAYETLSDPVLRASYDYRFRQRHTNPEKTETRKKNWSFDEKEMKRRQYYNEHIRKYEKATAAYNPEKHNSNYNEYKYILFATPIAVALFIFIMSLAGSSLPPPARTGAHEAVLDHAGISSIPEEPYAGYFGQPVYNLKGSCTMTVNNETGHDVIVCVFNGQKFVRSCFIKSFYYSELANLPCVPLHVRYFSGSDFDPVQPVPVAGVNGNFREPQGYFESESPVEVSSAHELELQPETSGFRKITEVEFFNKTIL
jgi:curved DNA-binding protein